MHELKQGESWNPFPPTRFEGDSAHRHEAYRAIWLSALGLNHVTDNVLCDLRRSA